mgnify:CR=1 FL=1
MHGSYDNTLVGYATGNLITTASNNTAVGRDALISNTTGQYNTALGGQDSATYPVLYANTTGIYNIAIGFQALTLCVKRNGSGGLRVNNHIFRNRIGAVVIAGSMLLLDLDRLLWA